MKFITLSNRECLPNWAHERIWRDARVYNATQLDGDIHWNLQKFFNVK